MIVINIAIVASIAIAIPATEAYSPLLHGHMTDMNRSNRHRYVRLNDLHHRMVAVNSPSEQVRGLHAAANGCRYALIFNRFNVFITFNDEVMKKAPVPQSEAVRCSLVCKTDTFRVSTSAKSDSYNGAVV
eukprot:s853_g2.t1